jgi:hypothetical protein
MVRPVINVKRYQCFSSVGAARGGPNFDHVNHL